MHEPGIVTSIYMTQVLLSLSLILIVCPQCFNTVSWLDRHMTHKNLHQDPLKWRVQCSWSRCGDYW